MGIAGTSPGFAPILRTVPDQPAARSSASTPDRHQHRRDWKRWALLSLYIAAYGGFIGVAVTAPALLATIVIGGINLAVVWGFALIVLAFVIALAALRLPEQG